MDPLVSHDRRSRRLEISRSPNASWGPPFVSGLLIALVGLVAFWTPVVTGVASAMLIGALLTAAGLIEVVGAIRNRHRGSIALPLLSGILTAVVGMLFLARPLLGVAALGLLLAAYFFATGLFRGITSIADRYPRWGWDFAYALIALAAGVFTLLGWPRSSLLLIGMLVGIELMARGVALMGIGWKVRGFLQEDRRDHAPASV